MSSPSKTPKSSAPAAAPAPASAPASAPATSPAPAAPTAAVAPATPPAAPPAEPPAPATSSAQAPAPVAAPASARKAVTTPKIPIPVMPTGGASTNAFVDDIIARLNGLYGNPDQSIVDVISASEIIPIIQMAANIFMEESNLVEAEAPIKVIGDTHAQFQDLNRLFDLIGRVPKERFMFLGDYVDRGPQGVEIVILLFCLKIRYRDRIYILRGNHETPAVNRIYGFYNEVAMKYGVGMWWDFQYAFNRIPMAGLISKRILCMHGGLSPEIASLDTFRDIPRPCEPQDSGLLIDILWSDPTNKGDGWFHSIRGISYMFGPGVVEQACKFLNIDMIIRGHQVVQDGYELMAGRKLITVFSAPNYIGEFTNAAAVVCLDASLKVSFQQLTMAPPAHGKAIAAPVIAADPDEKAAKADKDTIKKFGEK